MGVGGGEGEAADAEQQVLSCLSKPVSRYSRSRGRVIYLMTRRDAFASERDKQTEGVGSICCTLPTLAEPPLRSAERRCGEEEPASSAASVLVGFADVNKSRTCA